MALDAKELARITKEELEKLGEIESIEKINDPDDPSEVLGAMTIDGHGVFITFENY